MKSILARIMAVLLGAMVALGIAELAVRTLSPQMIGDVVFGYDEELGAIPVPHQRGRKTSPQGQSYSFSHNASGFRGSREYGPRKQAAFRVLFLGDSFTYGLGVNDEETLPQQVENILQARHYSVEVINAGNPGAGTDYELKFLQTLGPKLKPDLVVVCFFWNDFYDNAEGEHFSLVQGELVPQKPHSLTAKKARVENMPVIGWLLSWSHAANLIKVTTVNLLKRPGKPVNRERYSLKDAGYDRSLTEKLLGQMVKTAKALGSGIMFFYLPDEGQVKLYKASGEISHYEQDFGAMMRGLHEQPYSLTPALSQVPGDIELPYWGHYRAGTNLAAAQYISGPVEGWLKDRPRP